MMPLQLAPGVPITAFDQPGASGTHPLGAELPESRSASVGVLHNGKESYYRSLQEPSSTASSGGHGWPGPPGPMGPQQPGMQVRHACH